MVGGGPSESQVALGPPERWLECPRRGQLVEGRFLPFKTPLCSAYDGLVPEMYRFPPKMVFDVTTSEKQQVGLWVDLTKTSRFYPQKEVEAEGARYVKLKLQGHGEAPTEESCRTFVEICKDFWRQPGNAKKVVGVHCTHGFNRTGFLIAAFLCTERDWDVGAAVMRFAQARPPGIYKQHYIDELFKRFGDGEDPPLTAPPMPGWSNDAALELNDDEAAGEAGEGDEEGASTSQAPPPKDVPFFDGHCPAVTLVRDPAQRRELQKRINSICLWEKKGFPGGQPVSMDCQNGHFLRQRPYKVSWKADGVRYMMLIEDEGKVTVFDRDNTPYTVPGLRFPHRKEDRHVRNTLVDGEMVLDTAPDGAKVPRFLLYDIVLFEGQAVGACHFDRRLKCIETELIGPRNEAKRTGKINPGKEPFSVRQKGFYPLDQAAKLMGKDWAAKVGHETDGLIFQPCDEHYITGRNMAVLKWKPPHLNSVDFRLNLRRESAPGMLPELKGDLHVLHQDLPFGQLKKVTKEVKELNGKIVECTFDLKTGGWVFLRERTDKSFPNALTTAQGVYESIIKPVYEADILKLIAMVQKEQKEREAKKRSSNGQPNGQPPAKVAPMGPPTALPPHRPSV